EMTLQQRNRMVWREHPVIQRSLCQSSGPASPRQLPHARVGGRCSLKQRERRTIEQLSRPQLLQFFLDAARGIFADKLGGAELAGREVQGGKTYAIAQVRNRRQKIVFFGTERGIRCRARRDDTRHLPPHQLFGHAWIFYLITDSNFESAANELGNVSLGRMIGN